MYNMSVLEDPRRSTVTYSLASVHFWVECLDNLMGVTFLLRRQYTDIVVMVRTYSELQSLATQAQFVAVFKANNSGGAGSSGARCGEDGVSEAVVAEAAYEED